MRDNFVGCVGLTKVCSYMVMLSAGSIRAGE